MKEYLPIGKHPNAGLHKLLTTLTDRSFTTNKDTKNADRIAAPLKADLGLHCLSRILGIIHCMYYNVINQVISYWPSYRSEVCCIGPRRSRGPIQQTEDL